jgi:glycosyltransferase involved in cell wall biosynthesis
MQPENTKKRVVYVITKGVWGGAQKYVFSLATSLPKDKFDVTVICGEGKILKEKLEEKGVKTIQIKTLGRDISIFKEIISFFWLLNTIRKIKPDVLHLNSPKAGGIGSLIGRILFVPNIIYTSHGFAWNEERKNYHKILITFFTWITLLLSHKTITISSKEDREAKSLPLIFDDKIYLIKNGIEKIDFLNRVEARKELFAKINKNESEVFSIGTISELHRNKGLEHAITAVSKINSPFVFFILGGGELEKPLLNLIEKLEMKDKVFILGFVPEASKYLKAFDVFLLSSIKEGLPYTIIEAGQSETPIVASSVGGIPDIIDNGKEGILVTKAKPGEITRAIEFIIENKKESKEFAKNLKDKIDAEFSLDQMIEKTVKLY